MAAAGRVGSFGSSPPGLGAVHEARGDDDDDGQNLWSCILSEVSTRSRSKLPAGKNVLLLGPEVSDGAWGTIFSCRDGTEVSWIQVFGTYPAVLLVLCSELRNHSWWGQRDGLELHCPLCEYKAECNLSEPAGLAIFTERLDFCQHYNDENPHKSS